MQSADGKGYNQPMAERILYPRFVEERLTETLEDSPVVLIHGPRQCGKTTLAQMDCTPGQMSGEDGAQTGLSGIPRAFTYFTFDDSVVRAAAESDPMGFVADLPERVILDEVQRAPALFAALKIEVDRRRLPGRFLLTGSSNVLQTPALSDSLAGRMETVRLHPLAQREIGGGTNAAGSLEWSPRVSGLSI